MRTIIRIAKTELRVLFYSPIAWLILVIFAFQIGMQITEGFDYLLKIKLMGKSASNLTKFLLTGGMGAFSTVLSELYLYIPLLTMGLMSRELSSGLIKLLYSSPLSNRQIIFGKYISMMVYGLVLMGILFICSIFVAFSIKSPDIPLIFTALLGIYLMICAYSAIGLFMSTMTHYQVVAAMGTFVILTVLNFIGGIGQEYDFIRDITYWLSISGRSQIFMAGMICSLDVIYFILVIALFLSLSVIKLNGELENRSKLSNIARYGSVILIIITLGYISSRPSMIKYYDSTATKSNTLTKVSQHILSQIDDDITLTTYVNILDSKYYKGMPESTNNNNKKFNKYVRFKPSLKLEHVYYYDKGENPVLEQRFPGLKTEELFEKLCKYDDYDEDMFLTPTEIREKIDLSAENNTFIRSFKTGDGKQVFLRTFNDRASDPSEVEISSALKTLIQKSPVVGFVTGHQERDINKVNDRSYYTFAKQRDFRHSLINQGFTPINIDFYSEIPVDVDIIVISDTRSAYSQQEIVNFDKYLQRGGNLFILGEPNRQEAMNPIVERLGLKFSEDMLVQPSETNFDNLVIGNITDDGANKFNLLKMLKIKNYSILTPTTLALEDIGGAEFNVVTLLKTRGKGVWNEKNTTDFIDEKATINPELGEVEKSYSLMKYLTRNINNKEQRIFVIGDSDCISSFELNATRPDVNASNFSLVKLVFRTLSYGQFPIEVSREKPQDNEVYVTQGVFNFVKIIFIWIIPISIVLGFFFLWLVRRKN